MSPRVVLSIVALAVLSSGVETPRIPFTRALFAAAADSGDAPASDDAESLSLLAFVARRVRAAAAKGARRSVALNQTVFGELGFVREVDDTDLRFVLLPSVLEARRGSCVGLGTLYIALGEVLGWRVDGVMVPGHFFVRVEEGGKWQNVELLRRGEAMPDAWYRTRFAAPGSGAPEYGRSLSRKEVLGVIEYDVGNERLRQGRLAESRRAYAVAVRVFPAFAEAHASLGAALHVEGALTDALESYQAARRENPELPGVDRNIELLHAELAARPPPAQ